MSRVRIRKPDDDETPLSVDEEWVAIRLGIEPAPSLPSWHPSIFRNWSVMTARLHRADAVRHLTEE